MVYPYFKLDKEANEKFVLELISGIKNNLFVHTSIKKYDILQLTKVELSNRQSNLIIQLGSPQKMAPNTRCKYAQALGVDEGRFANNYLLFLQVVKAKNTYLQVV